MYQIYEIRRCKSYVESEEVNSIGIKNFILGKLSEGYIVCWLHYEVLFGKMKNSAFVFYNGNDPDFERYLVELRAFNENEELRIWRRMGTFFYRYRKDNEGEENEYIDAEQVMFGTKSEGSNDSFHKITESKGIEYYLPSEFLNGKTLSPKTQRLILHTRNYIGYNDFGQAGFVDSRFLKIKAEGV